MTTFLTVFMIFWAIALIILLWPSIPAFFSCIEGLITPFKGKV
jgi:hypothetical protein